MSSGASPYGSTASVKRPGRRVRTISLLHQDLTYGNWKRENRTRANIDWYQMIRLPRIETGIPPAPDRCPARFCPPYINPPPKLKDSLDTVRSS